MGAYVDLSLYSICYSTFRVLTLGTRGLLGGLGFRGGPGGIC